MFLMIHYLINSQLKRNAWKTTPGLKPATVTNFCKYIIQITIWHEPAQVHFP